MAAQAATQACPVYHGTLSRARPCCGLDDAGVWRAMAKSQGAQSKMQCLTLWHSPFYSTLFALSQLCCYSPLLLRNIPMSQLLPAVPLTASIEAAHTSLGCSYSNSQTAMIGLEQMSRIVPMVAHQVPWNFCIPLDKQSSEPCDFTDVGGPH